MTKYRDTEYPRFTFRSWDNFDYHPAMSEPIYHLPDPAKARYHAVTFYDGMADWRAQEDPSVEIPITRLYRVCLTIAGPGETNSGEAFIRGQEPAHIHKVWGWSDTPGNRLVRADWKYLKQEFRRPEWEVEHE
jgi:hypothetical protein